MPAIADGPLCLKQCQLLMKAARALDIPVRASEHCPASIGKTVPAICDHLKPEEIFSKSHFDGSAETTLMGSIEKLDRATIVVGGTEAHVCVLQTILGLKGRGYNPVLVADATSSRDKSSRDLAVDRIRHHGIDVVSTEMVVFEWLQIGGTPTFKELLPMIKSGQVDDKC